MRLFLALPLPGPVRRPLSDYIAAHRMRFPELRWVDPEQAHVTLRFLGAVDPAPALESLRTAFPEPVCDRSFMLSTCGAFGNGRKLPGVYWLGGGFPGWVRALAARFACLPDDAGRTGHAAGFVPHVSVARRGGYGGPVELAAPGPWEGIFEEVVLYDSELTRSGPVYRRVGGIQLPGE